MLTCAPRVLDCPRPCCPLLQPGRRSTQRAPSCMEGAPGGACQDGLIAVHSPFILGFTDLLFSYLSYSACHETALAENPHALRAYQSHERDSITLDDCGVRRHVCRFRHSLKNWCTSKSIASKSCPAMSHLARVQLMVAGCSSGAAPCFCRGKPDTRTAKDINRQLPSVHDPPPPFFYHALTCAAAGQVSAYNGSLNALDRAIPSYTTNLGSVHVLHLHGCTAPRSRSIARLRGCYAGEVASHTCGCSPDGPEQPSVRCAEQHGRLR